MIQDEDENETITSNITRPLIDNQESDGTSAPESIRIRNNFLLMSLLFAINHGCTVSVLGLSNARLGSVGVWQSGMLYGSYTASALYGASYFVKKFGSRNGLVLGMGMSASYVTSFFFATIIVEKNESLIWLQSLVAICGALVGGVGSSILWVSQGTFFTSSAQLYASTNDGQVVEHVTSRFGGNFSFIFLIFEVILRLLSTFLIETLGISWKVIFGMYSVLSIVPVFFMIGVLDIERYQYNLLQTEDSEEDNTSPSYKATAALNLLKRDRKAIYLAPVNILFGLATSFSASVLSGVIIQKVLNDPNSKYVGLYTSITSLVASGASLFFGRIQSQMRYGKERVLTSGALSYLAIALQFLVFPDGNNWTAFTLMSSYILLGIGRATYEGTLRAVFADVFPHHKEGAFGNIILFSGGASTLGYILSVTNALECNQASRYCLEYSDGSIHNILLSEILIILSAVVAIPSLWKAVRIHRNEHHNNE